MQRRQMASLEWANPSLLPCNPAICLPTPCHCLPLSLAQWPRDAVLARHLLAQAQAKLRNQGTGRRTAVRHRGLTESGNT